MTARTSAIVQEGVSWARSLGLSELASDCEISNERSQKLHLSAGFEEVQRNISFWRDLTEDATQDQL